MGVKIASLIKNIKNQFGFIRHLSRATIHFESDRDFVVFCLCGACLLIIFIV